MFKKTTKTLIYSQQGPLSVGLFGCILDKYGYWWSLYTQPAKSIVHVPLLIHIKELQTLFALIEIEGEKIEMWAPA